MPHFTWDISFGTLISAASIGMTLAFAAGKVVEAIDRIGAEVSELRTLHFEHSREDNERFNQLNASLALVSSAKKG